jgi:hypothetical protein
VQARLAVKYQSAMKKRSYFTLIVFLVLGVFLVFIAISSWNYRPSAGGIPPVGGRTMYLAVVARGACSRPPCPPALTPTPYPAALDLFGIRRR